MNDDEKLYVRFRGRTVGPLTSQKVRDMVRRGQITRLHELSDDGTSWSNADQFRDFFASVRAEITKNLGPLSTSAPQSTTSAMESVGGSFLTPQPAAEPKVEWYAHVDDEHQGPMSLDVMRQWKDSGRVQGNTLVWRTGLETWLPAKKAIPELFQAAQREPARPAAEEAKASSATSDTLASGGLAGLAIELNRRRVWASIFAITLIIISGLMIAGHVMTLSVFASQGSEGANTIPAVIGGILGIGFAVTVLTAGLLLLRYCHKVKLLAFQQNDSLALEAAQRLSAFWSFVGISAVVWLVVMTAAVLIFVAIGVSFWNASTLSVACSNFPLQLGTPEPAS